MQTILWKVRYQQDFIYLFNKVITDKKKMLKTYHHIIVIWVQNVFLLPQHLLYILK